MKSMNNYSSFISRNIMLAGNIVANLAGMMLFTIIENFAVVPSTEQAEIILAQIRQVYFPCAYLIMIFLTIHYEKPIRSFLTKNQNSENIDLTLKEKARQRVLNEPFFLLLLDFSIWVVSALLFPVILWGNGITGKIMFRLFCQKFFMGVIITTCAFFLLEMILRKKLIPIFFPEGGLYKTARIFRIRIKTRLTALLVGINIIPLTAFFIMGMATYSRHFSETELLLRFRSAVLFNVLGFMILGIFLVFLVTSSLSKPFGDIIKKLRQIKKGQFDGKIKVLSNDEIGYTAEVINDMAEGLKDRDFIKDAFGKYVAKEVRDEVLSGNIPLDGEQKEVTVLFTDLRNFTPMVEKYEPKQTIQMMNMYFKEMAQAIQENNGLVLQFIGDEIYAVFGAPVYDKYHPTHAVKAAIALQKSLIKLNVEFKKKNWPPLVHGVGIHSGKALAANMGSPERMSYLLVGNTVNIASRLQGLNKEFQTETILSQTTYEELSAEIMNEAEFFPLGAADLKGIKDKIKIFSLNIKD